MAGQVVSHVRCPRAIHGEIGFRPLEDLSAYATTFRYSLTPMPRIDELRDILTTLTGLYASARSELLGK